VQSEDKSELDPKSRKCICPSLEVGVGFGSEGFWCFLGFGLECLSGLRAF
jgi:hypothetical protein